MKNKLKRILGVITAISLLLQMSFVITSNAAEYFSLDFESATDTMGWTSANAPGDMSIATDEDNSINISNLQIQTEVEHEMHTIPSILTLRQRKMVKQLSNLTSI